MEGNENLLTHTNPGLLCEVKTVKFMKEMFAFFPLASTISKAFIWLPRVELKSSLAKRLGM